MAGIASVAHRIIVGNICHKESIGCTFHKKYIEDTSHGKNEYSDCIKRPDDQVATEYHH